MPTISLNDNTTDIPTQFDILIVGAGAAGLTIANEFVGTTKRVCVLESGGWQRSKTSDDLNEFESVGRPRTKDAPVRCRGVGGTTALWTGRCGEFDQIDYAERSWLPISGWPITYSDMKPFLTRADGILILPSLPSASKGLRQLDSPVDQPSWNEKFFSTVGWRYSSSSEAHIRQFASKENSLGVLDHSGSPIALNLGHFLGPKIAQSENVVVITDATVMQILADKAGPVVYGAMVAAPNKKTARLFASQVVLACGGIENARLLLDSQGSNKKGLGNDHDQVGRYLTDHTYTILGTYQGSSGAAVRRRLGTRWINQQGQRKIASFGLGLCADLQKREELLNAAIHIVEFGEKQSAVSSIASAARTLKARGSYLQAAKELYDGMSRPSSLLSGILDRFIRKMPQLHTPDFTLVGCVVEQELNPDSRITLSDKTNWLGQRLPVLDWRFSNREYLTARRTAELFFADLERLNLPRPVPADWIEAGEEAWSDSLTDLAHPMCTTRMSRDPAEGVVDQNCQVHGVAGLFVAGSSVFATPGHMNPTHNIVALSLRLADHLKGPSFSASASFDGRAATSVDQ